MKRIEKQRWKEIDKTGWQLDGYMSPGNTVSRAIVYKYGITAFAVYAFILSHRNTTTNECFPSVQTIADELFISKSTVEKAITKLYNGGFILINSGKQGVNNNYYFPKESFFKENENDIKQLLAYRHSTPGFKTKREIDDGGLGF